MLLLNWKDSTYLQQGTKTLKLGEEFQSVDTQSFPGAVTQEIEGILGTISLKISKYLITINKSEIVGKILNSNIYKITSTSIVPLTSSAAEYDQDEHKYLDYLRFQLDTSNLFFSHDYDLTNSAQRNFSKKLSTDITLLDRRFFWNEYLCKELISGDKKLRSFVTPVISGYCKIHFEKINGEEISLGLITRRSKFRAGTRYFRRGIDSKGHVANYNETEQVLCYKDTFISYLQTRGSVPVYWAEINNLKYKPSLQISEHFKESVEAARIHFDEQVSYYGENFLVNLVNQKGYEKPVKEAYEKTVEALGNKKLKYIYFDFHHECRKMQWHRVLLLIEKLKELGLDGNDYFIGTYNKNMEISIVKTQSHVVRTNCMDCLDRTNVVQSTLGRYFLQNQLEYLNILKKDERWDTNKGLNFEFQNFWADNADAVSCVYSGTGALKTDFTRTGERTRKGALKDLQNSISRYLKNNYNDGKRQDSFDLILGEYIPKKDESPFIDARPYQYKYSVTIFKFFFSLIFLALIKVILHGYTGKSKALFTIAFLGLASSGVFMFSNGMQVVDWPKLKPVEYLKKEPVYKEGQLIGVRYVKNSEF